MCRRTRFRFELRNRDPLTESAELTRITHAIQRLRRERNIHLITEAARIYFAENPADERIWRVGVPNQVAEHAGTRTHPPQAIQFDATGGKSAVERFDSLVQEHRRANPTASYGDAVTVVAHENRELAEQCRIELSVPIGPGGVRMTSVK